MPGATLVDSSGVKVDSPISMPAALGAWFAAWVSANLLLAPLAITAAGYDLDDPISAGLFTTQVAVLWPVMLLACVLVSRFAGSRDTVADLGIAAKPIDLIGLPLGAAAQFGLGVLYWPLRELWPETFSTDDVERSARELADAATGGWAVVIGAGVIVGAPLVEELMYRGVLQRSAASTLGRGTAWIVTSLFFAAIHFSAIQIPGLFMAGLLFGAGVLVTGRIGFGVAAHVGFNLVGFIGAMSA